MESYAALALALRHHRAGDINAAIEAGREAAKHHAPAAARMLGLLLAEAGQLDEALLWVRRAVAADRSAETLAAEGRVRALMEDWIGASAALHEALGLRPGFVPALHLLQSVESAGLAKRHKAETLFAAGRFADAADRFQEAAALRPADADARHGLGTALHEAGAPAEATSAYRAALALQPGRVETWHNLGSAMQATGDLDAAMAAYGQAYARDPACFARIAQELAAGRTGQVWLSATALKARLEISGHGSRSDTRQAPPEPPRQPP